MLDRRADEVPEVGRARDVAGDGYGVAADAVQRSHGGVERRAVPPGDDHPRTAARERSRDAAAYALAAAGDDHGLAGKREHDRHSGL